MGVEVPLASARLRPVLLLLLAACGGRYGSTGESAQAGGSGNDTPGAAGSGPHGGTDTTGQGGGPAGKGGAIVSGGASTGGFAIAGTSAVAGSVSVAGTSTGTGGGPPSNLNKQLCDTYCSRLSTPCRDRDAASCAKNCFTKLETASDVCLGTLRQNVICLAEAVIQASSCTGAVAVASKLCGSTDAQPIECDVAPSCQVDYYADVSGCHTATTCGGITADLYCPETSGPIVCGCYVGGKNVLNLMSGATTSKGACTDDVLRLACAQLLP